MTQALEDFFAGGVTAAKFEDGAFGTIIGGTIVTDPRMAQQRDYTTNEPIVYPDGNAAMQMIVTVQAMASLNDDDGRRAFYLKGQMKEAVGEALRKAEVKVPARGGKLFIKYVEDKPTTLKNGKKGNPQKIYVAKYEPPAQAAGGQFFADAPSVEEPAATTQQARVPSLAEATQTPPTGAGTGYGGRLCPAGVDPAKWAAMNPAQRAQMYDALGLDSGSTYQEPVGGAAFRDEPPF